MSLLRVAILSQSVCLVELLTKFVSHPITTDFGSDPHLDLNTL